MCNTKGPALAHTGLTCTCQGPQLWRARAVAATCSSPLPLTDRPYKHEAACQCTWTAAAAPPSTPTFIHGYLCLCRGHRTLRDRGELQPSSFSPAWSPQVRSCHRREQRIKPCSYSLTGLVVMPGGSSPVLFSCLVPTGAQLPPEEATRKPQQLLTDRPSGHARGLQPSSFFLPGPHRCAAATGESDMQTPAATH